MVFIINRSEEIHPLLLLCSFRNPKRLVCGLHHLNYKFISQVELTKEGLSESVLCWAITWLTIIAIC